MYSDRPRMQLSGVGPGSRRRLALACSLEPGRLCRRGLYPFVAEFGLTLKLAGGAIIPSVLAAIPSLARLDQPPDRRFRCEPGDHRRSHAATRLGHRNCTERQTVAPRNALSGPTLACRREWTRS
jgi:hypothetical protein